MAGPRGERDPATCGRYGPLRRPLALVTFPAAPRGSHLVSRAAATLRPIA